MTAPKRKPAAKHAPTPEPAKQQAPAQEEAPEPETKQPEPEAPEHVRTLARVVRQHISKQHHHFEAAQGVPVMYGYNGLSHVVNGQAVRHIATRDELGEMSDQQIYDRVMQGRQPPRQGFPTGGQR